MKYIDSKKLIAEIERRKQIHKSNIENGFPDEANKITEDDNILYLIRTLQQEQPMSDSTQLIEFWNETKEMLKEKDFRDDAWRLAYNAFMCGFVRGVSVKKQEPQEGLHFTPLNRLIQKIPFENWNDTVNNYAKKLCDCLIKEGYLKDAEVLQGYISYMNGNNVPMATMDEQEQPEVDLDREIIKYKVPFTDDREYLDETTLDAIARHFYELGLNVRKE